MRPKDCGYSYLSPHINISKEVLLYEALLSDLVLKRNYYLNIKHNLKRSWSNSNSDLDIMLSTPVFPSHNFNCFADVIV